MTWLRYTIFKPNPMGHGGEKRTAQISEMLDKAEINYCILKKPQGKVKINIEYIYYVFYAFLLYLKIMTSIKKRFSPVRLLKRSIWAANRLRLFKGIENGGILLWEATRMEHAFCISFFKKKGYKIVAIPHNLESLVPTQESALTGKKSPQWLMEEIAILKKCDIVFAISKEETLFLRQCSIKAKYFPYYPPKDTVDFLRSVKQKRKNIISPHMGKKQILMLGSANNPPTKIGMIDRINFFLNDKEIDCKLIVAGHYTESLKEYIKNSDKINLIGSLSQAQLEYWMVHTDMVLVHQPPTSGALTRITEFMIGGIPVLTNFESARNFWEINGIFVYDSDEELRKILKNSKLEPPSS